MTIVSSSFRDILIFLRNTVEVWKKCYILDFYSKIYDENRFKHNH